MCSQLQLKGHTEEPTDLLPLSSRLHGSLQSLPWLKLKEKPSSFQPLTAPSGRFSPTV